MKFKVECAKCGCAANPVEIDLDGINLPDSGIGKELEISDKQRECPNCQSKWNSIHLFLNNAGQLTFARGEE